ncbi:MAG: hypothetical protein Q8R31_05935 [Candidatus Omnitrophota bacterium]|nr:hypothetical protein [Candidatus Omnitrophota bacterium]
MTIAAECPNCNLIFEGESDFSVRNERDEHLQYCVLPLGHKILQNLLFLLLLIAMPLIVMVMVLVVILHPIAYPFLYAMDLFLNNKVLTWKEYQKRLGLLPEVSTRKKVKAAKDLEI